MTDWRQRARAACTSLKLRIVLGALATLALGIGATTLLLVQRAEQDTLALQSRFELGEAARSADLLSRRMVELQRGLAAASAQLDSAVLGDTQRLDAFLQAMPVLRSQFSNLFAAAPDGRMLSFVDATGFRHPALNLADRDYFRRTLAEHRPIVSEPLAGRISDEPVIVFTHPLRDGDRVTGVLGGALRLASRDLLGDLVDNPADPSGAVRVVTDAQGRVLAHPDRAYLMKSLATDPRFSVAFAAWVASGSPVEPAGLHFDQAGHLVSVGGVAGPDWVVWRALPEGELLAPLHAARRQALAWAGALMAAASLAMFAFVWYLLRPLTLLEHRAQRLFDATQDPQDGWPDAQGEIGRLARVLRHVGAERVQLEAFNDELLRKLGSVMSSAPVGIAFTRAQRFELVSAEFCRLFGREESALLGQPARMIYVSNEDYDAVGPQVRDAFAAGLPYVGEWRLLRSDGSHFWAQLRGKPVDAADPACGTIWTVNHIGAQVAERERLEWSASHDPLTGLANRKAFEARMARVLAALPRSLPSAVVMIDLDHFKPINDRHGHAAGDAMLKAVAVAITACVRASDLVVRLGGDEFALLLERCPPEVVVRVAEAVHQAITDTSLPWDGQHLQVGASLGLAMLTPDTDSAADWLKAADAACYAAKAAGRGAIRDATRHEPRDLGSEGPR